MPTLTPHPVSDAAFELSTSGNEEYIRTFPAVEVDGVTISETTVTSAYPRGMIFEMSADNDADNIEAVRLVANYRSGETERFRAEEENGTWTAHIWDRGSGIPAWVPFEFHWLIIDADGDEVTTNAHHVEYWDSTREWARIDLESASVLLYNYEHILSTEEVAALTNEKPFEE